MTNREIAERFEHVADLLRARRAHPRQIGAWRSAAAVLRNHRVELSVVVDRDGWGVLERLPRLGVGLRLAVRELMQTGQLGTLEELRITDDRHERSSERRAERELETVHDGVHCRGGRGAGGRRSPTPGQPAAWVGT